MSSPKTATSARAQRRNMAGRTLAKGLVSVARWAAVLLYCALVFVVSSASRLTGPVDRSGIPEPICHAALFTPLGALLYAAVGHRRQGRHLLLTLAMTVAPGMIYALFDELHQQFVPGRGWDATDIAGDAAGLVLGGSLLMWVSREGRGEAK